MKVLSIITIILTWLSVGLFFILGMFIPFTIGVSAILMPAPLAIIIISFFICRGLLRKPELKRSSKLAGFLQACFIVDKIFIYIFLGALGLAIVAASIGAFFVLVSKLFG